MLTFFTHRAFISFLSITLMALLTYQLAIFTWNNVDLSAQANAVMPLSAQASNANNSELSHAQLIRNIIKNKPFGDVLITQAAATIEEAITAPETQLNYKLRGIYYSANELLSSAIIEINPANVESYALKDEIENGIIIHSIALNRIVLDRYGKFETLSLEEIKFDKKNKVLQAVSAASNPAHSRLLKNYRKRFVNNPMALARKFRSIPVTENGKNIGFKLKAVNGETLLKKLNVPNNAIFTSINGVGLDKPFQALDALRSLQTAKSISVTYLVDGVEQSRDFNL